MHRQTRSLTKNDQEESGNEPVALQQRFKLIPLRAKAKDIPTYKSRVMVK